MEKLRDEGKFHDASLIQDLLTKVKGNQQDGASPVRKLPRRRLFAKTTTTAMSDTELPRVPVTMSDTDL